MDKIGIKCSLMTQHIFDFDHTIWLYYCAYSFLTVFDTRMGILSLRGENNTEKPASLLISTLNMCEKNDKYSDGQLRFQGSRSDTGLETMEVSFE